MAGEIKAIETRYKGYRFRSRLEARWAVFFDALGLRWQYELQGFNFGGLCYLPDFYLPDWDTFFEVKPDLPMEDFGDGFISVFDHSGHTTLGKFILASDGLNAATREAGPGGAERTVTKNRLSMLCGVPGIPSLRITSEGRWELVDGAVVVTARFIPRRMESGETCRDPVFGVEAFAYVEGGKRLDIWPLYCTGNKASGFGRVGPSAAPTLVSPLLPGSTMRHFYVGDGVVYNHLDLVNAYRAARSARFERGVSPC